MTTKKTKKKEQSLKDICKELKIFHTNDIKELADWINYQLDLSLLKEQRLKDL